MRCYCHICVVVQNQSIKHLHSSAGEWAGVNKETTDVSYIFCAIPQENRRKFEHSDKTSPHMHRLLLGGRHDFKSFHANKHWISGVMRSMSTEKKPHKSTKPSHQKSAFLVQAPC